MAKLLRWHRLARFSEVWRTEGAGAALRATRRQVRLAWYGQSPEAQVPQAAAGQCALISVWSDLAQNGAFQVTAAPALQRRRRRVAMIGDLNLPQCRKYRVEQLDEIWRRAGVSYGYAHFEDVPRCLDLLQSATHLMLYRLGHSHLSEMYLYEARRLRLPVIYDIDDPLFSFAAYETYSNGAALPSEMRRALVGQSPSYLAVMQQADALSLSTPGLVDLAAHHCPRPAFLRRNFADRATLELGSRLASRERGPGFTIAFASGSLGHEIDFLTMAEDLLEFLQSGEGRRLLILGRFDLERLPAGISSRADVAPFGDYASYLRALGKANCAVLPLTDDMFNRCKSAVRVIDAAAVGIPSVVGTVGDGQSVVRDGETGLIASPGAGSWLAALERLAEDPAGADRLGRRAREDLEGQWAASMELPVVAPELLAEITG
ncbi:MAG: hypothetical protein QNJ13_11875 [Paracoccaceae bacterium]|nr:hypothetical protein [Paracoccaceae bacterium]